MTDTTLRRKVFDILERDRGPGIGTNPVEVVLVGLILVNAVAVVLETVPYMHFRYLWVFRVIEYVSVAAFTVEYLLRLWVCVERADLRRLRWKRLRFALRPLALIDLLAIAPFFLSLVFPIDLRILRVLRLLRILKLARYSSALTMLLAVIEEEASSFLAAIVILMILLILASSGAYLAEHRVQPDKFGSIPAAMWWAIATLTTVGYGDVTPVTTAGRVFGGIVAVIGVGMAALPAGILASGMADQMRRRRVDMANRFRHALADGRIEPEERAAIEATRRRLGLSRRMARDILDEVRRYRDLRAQMVCPHCGKHPDDPRDAGQSASAG